MQYRPYIFYFTLPTPKFNHEQYKYTKKKKKLN